MEIRFTTAFKRRLKKLKKDYRHVTEDIQPIITELEQGNLIGSQISGIQQTVFKVRAANRDIPTGKSGGYRLIYQLIDNQLVLLLILYAKSDQTNISVDEIKQIIKETLD